MASRGAEFQQQIQQKVQQRVQQKMLHSRHLLTLAESISDTEIQKQRALLEAAAQAMVVCLRLYLRELAAVSGIKEPLRVYTLEDFDNLSVLPAAIIELRSSDWCYNLLQLERYLLNPPIDSGAVVQTIPIGLNKQLSDVFDQLNLDLLQNWQLQLQELIERQRASQLEY